MFNSLFGNKKNNITMTYTVREIDLTGQGEFFKIPQEIWTIGNKSIITPHGSLKIKKYIIVREGPMVGIQFSVSGSLDLSMFNNKGETAIFTFAIMRQPHNVWLWGYAFDKANRPTVNFCGNDELDGLFHFVNELESAS